MYAVECRNIRKNYGDIEALKGINLKIEKNKITALLGTGAPLSDLFTAFWTSALYLLISSLFFKWAVKSARESGMLANY